jgi:hypothetical protein
MLELNKRQQTEDIMSGQRERAETVKDLVIIIAISLAFKRQKVSFFLVSLNNVQSQNFQSQNRQALKG